MLSNSMKNKREQDIAEWAKKHLNEEVTVKKELHGDRSDVFKIYTQDATYFLKVGADLEKEKMRLEWLQGKLPVPKIIVFEKMGAKEALLLSEIKGKNLKVLSKEWAPEKVVTMLAEALKTFHSVPSENWFLEGETEEILIHGDASLPNFIFDKEEFSGYIDLGDVNLGNKETDFAAAIWSLQYNLGDGYGKSFLEKYGEENNDEVRVEELRMKYEDMQREWGLL